MKWTEGAQAPEGKHTSNSLKCGNEYFYQDEGQRSEWHQHLQINPEGAGVPNPCAADRGQAQQRLLGALANEPHRSPGCVIWVPMAVLIKEASHPTGAIFQSVGMMTSQLPERPRATF